MTPFAPPEFLAPLLTAAAAGGIVGLEREWRGRAAGFRTHILVALASAVLMQLALSQADWAFEALPGERLVADPVRMAHGVLTGIGFLCAGVIFRTGFSIHGLTTAASLWTTSAIGLVFGAGLYALGATVTVLTLAILLALRLVSLKLPAKDVIDVTVSWRRNDTSPEDEVEAVLTDMTDALHADGIELCAEASLITRSWWFKTRGAGDLKALSKRLNSLDGVVAFTLDPRDM
jgi:putative Mg2+ transporter-C (MgtC) family protein